MNLDDLERFRQLDQHHMLAEIDSLPAQLASAWALSQSMPLPPSNDLTHIVVAGMGGSAIGADLAAAYARPAAALPIIIWRDYDLPAFARGPHCLVVGSSHSGNTEETLSAYQAAVHAGATRIALTTGGELARLADRFGDVTWRFDHRGQPRAAVGYSFGLLLGLLCRLGVLPDARAEVDSAVQIMRVQQQTIGAESQVTRNPAKRMAGQLMERWPTIIGAGFLAPVARRWRTQIAELAKAVAQFEELPEADHNLVAGVLHPEPLFARTMVVFLQAALLPEANRRRGQVTRELLMVEGFNTDTVEAAGATRLAQQWSLLHFGDYAAYYLAMAYGVDPTPVEAIENLKQRLRE
jgi:glucose/mannose-6-phosphate isomerase